MENEVLTRATCGGLLQSVTRFVLRRLKVGEEFVFSTLENVENERKKERKGKRIEREGVRSAAVELEIWKFILKMRRSRNNGKITIKVSRKQEQINLNRFSLFQ